MPQKPRHPTPHPDASSCPPYEYEYAKLPIDIITGDEAIRRGLEEGRGLDGMEVGWQEELKGFLALRKQYLIYE